LDYAPLVVDIQIIKEFVQNIRCTIIISSEDKIKFISDIFKNIKKINTLHLTNKELLKLTIQEFARILNCIWQKHLKRVKITRHFKNWWNNKLQAKLLDYRAFKQIEE